MKNRNSILIKNGMVVGNEQKQLNIYIEDGVVQEIGEALNRNADIEIDAKGCFVMPAFVDMHVHLREPGLEYKEDIESGSRAAVAGGFCAVACMPNTEPVLDNVPLIKYIVDRSKEVGLCRVLPIGTITKRREGKELAEMLLMSKAGAVAFSDDGSPVSNSLTMRFALEYAGKNNLLIISHAEDLDLVDKGAANEGKNATLAGIRGITRASEDICTARDIILAATLDVPIHIAHVSTKGSVDIIRFAKSKGIKVTCETAPHYFCATDDAILDYNTNSKINPPLREASDVDAVIEGLVDGTIDAIATDHAPHHEDEKNREYELALSGTIGLQTAYSLAYERLVESKKISMCKLVELMSVNPARILGQSDLGNITFGAKANITIADTNTKYVFSQDRILSKAKNSLFLDWKLKGEIKYTIVDGEIKYSI